MAYKIIIHSDSKPYLVEVPQLKDFAYSIGGDPEYHYDKYEQALSTALADESKHIEFKDSDKVIALIWDRKTDHYTAFLEGYFYQWAVLNEGKTFDLPENICVSISTNCDAYAACGRAEFCLAEESGEKCTAKKLAILTPKPTGVEPSKQKPPEGIEASPKRSELYEKVLTILKKIPIADNPNGCDRYGIDSACAELEDVFIKESLKKRPTSSEQKPILSMGEILDRVANDHSYDSWGDLCNDCNVPSLVSYAKEAMQEYAQQSMKQERERAIQECIDKVKLQCSYCSYEKDGEELIDQLEKLKK